MHQLCSEVVFRRFAGTEVERDFVEAPSQMLENWCYEPEPLLMMSGHYQDNSQKLPQDLLQSIIDSKKANAGIFNKRQCILGLFDQWIHTHEKADTAKVWEQVRSERGSRGSCPQRERERERERERHTQESEIASNIQSHLIFVDKFIQICAEHWPIAPTPGTNFAAGFGHMAGGYDSQYYGYMWSEVYSADMFEVR
jgi:thimet oligopeptidase